MRRNRGYYTEQFLQLPSKKAIRLWETCEEELQYEMLHELANLHEMSVFKVIRNIASRPGSILNLTQKDVNLLFQQLEDRRKFESDPDITLDQALSFDLSSERNRKEYDSMEDWEKENFSRKFKAIKLIIKE